MNLFSQRRSAFGGFSLVELAIVLVILGLLTGGILAGQSLIRAAQLRAVSSEVAQLRASTYTFRDKYLALPGDITNASAFWGCTNCNGNGDGRINSHTADTQIAADRWEDSLVMYHLSQAGLINGTYTGNYIAAGARINSADNAYPSRLPRTFFAMARPDIWGATAGLAGTPWAICLSDGNRSFTCNGPQSASNTYDLYAEDAWNIDTKIDDGSARNGKMLADSCHILANRWGFDDITIYRSANPDLEYDLPNRVNSCGLMFLP